MTAWLYLVAAIGFEIGGTSLLKMSNGFEKTGLGMASIGAYTCSFWMLAPALKTIPVGIAYAIWAGVGIAAIAMIGFFFFEQRLQALQYGFIALILIGAVGLRLTTDV